MRLLALFFACYFAFLSCLTCTDEAPVCQDQQQTTIGASHSDCGTGTLGDWCSPLCQCHCCGGAIVPAALTAQAAYPPAHRVGSQPPPRPLGRGRPHAGTRGRVAAAAGLTLPPLSC
ncbi:cyclohexanecarboxylate-CoA ligase [Hymenobacter setariae]|jgi:hypothetical protein|uniref:Cyclohexanecarboxylate-CoA ligase n=1 Tax=Hymenobacter setariae TaxID=2594794 RepID=A0A558BKC5_9BACT|nr:DUF6660 family protein [Hymenobacter setariae]TVT36957.1 cyclohexanecarboxylate-CoA ligase [Hymenobacter setariae]